ncbi:MAG: hypothetical protein KIY11_02020 [Thermoplasmata archaeon]|nr:hypothetical protein [Candidatus Sysuiplasma acidicola]
MEKEHSRIACMLEWLNHIRHSNVVVLLKNGEETETVRFLRKQSDRTTHPMQQPVKNL